MLTRHRLRACREDVALGNQPVMTLQEVARYFRVHPNTVYRLAQGGALPAFKVGSDWRFNRESIDVWRLQQERQVRAPTANWNMLSPLPG